MIDIIIRTTLCFFILLLLTRILGIKQMSQMTFFNYVTGITIGSIAAAMVLSADSFFSNELIALLWWCFLTFFLAFITLKSTKLREILDGQPVILIKKGILDRNSLNKTRISLEDLLIMLREQLIFSIVEVDYAILEPNGKLSVLKKIEYLSPTLKDLNIHNAYPKYLPTQLIVDGKLLYKNLIELDISIKWLDEQLNKKNIYDIKDVFYAEIQQDGSLYIAKYEN